MRRRAQIDQLPDDDMLVIALWRDDMRDARIARQDCPKQSPRQIDSPTE